MIVVTPTDRWIRSAVGRCTKVFRVASPYISRYLVEVLAGVSPAIRVTILTRTLLLDFASNSSDYEAVCELCSRYDGLLSLSTLHAKTYVVDGAVALVTSANATYSGMYRNQECGVEIADPDSVEILSRNFDAGFGAKPAPQRWTLADLEALRPAVAAIRTALPKRDRLPKLDVEAPQAIRIPRKNIHRLAESFSGWKQIVFEAVLRLNATEFRLEEIYRSAEPMAQRAFPGNRNVRPKIRQQLQALRDLGLIRFIAPGRYELLTKPV